MAGREACEGRNCSGRRRSAQEAYRSLGAKACEGRNCSGRKRSAQEAYRSLGARRARAGTALALGAKCAGSVQAKNAATSGDSAAVDAEKGVLDQP